MEKEILTKCGYRCSLCLAYKPLVEKKDQRQLLSDGWFKINRKFKEKSLAQDFCNFLNDPCNKRKAGFSPQQKNIKYYVV